MNSSSTLAETGTRALVSGEPEDLSGLRSVSPRVHGGGFSKSGRFPSSANPSSPGPIYLVPSLGDSQHVQSHVYRPDTSDAAAMSATRNRASWLLGSTTNDLAHYKQIADVKGPAAYLPSRELVEKTPPRPVFLSSKRFSTKVATPGCESEHLCRHSPGPAYYPQTSAFELRAKTPPAHSFGSANALADRSRFVRGRVQQEYYYNVDDATRNCTWGAPEKGEAATMPTSPRPAMAKAARFNSNGAVRASPGPCYYPANHAIKPPARIAVVAKGKWVP